MRLLEHEAGQYTASDAITVVMRTALPEQRKMFSKLPDAGDVTLPRDG